MIHGVHMLIYSDNAEADRSLLRDVLGYPYVDDGDGWLIFKLPPAEVGVHPTWEGQGPRVELNFMCEDIEVTLAELKNHGVEAVAPVSKEDWGIATTIQLVGGTKVGLYQPLHRTAIDL